MKSCEFFEYLQELKEAGKLIKIKVLVPEGNIERSETEIHEDVTGEAKIPFMNVYELSDIEKFSLRSNQIWTCRK